MGGTKYWYICTIFGLNSKKKKIIIEQRREKVKLRKVIRKIIFIETRYRRVGTEGLSTFCDAPVKKNTAYETC